MHRLLVALPRGVLKGNPVRVRDCPAAVSRIERPVVTGFLRNREDGLVETPPCKRRPCLQVRRPASSRAKPGVNIERASEGRLAMIWCVSKSLHFISSLVSSAEEGVYGNVRSRQCCKVDGAVSCFGEFISDADSEAKRIARVRRCKQDRPSGVALL